MSEKVDGMKHEKIFLLIALAAILASILYLESLKPSRKTEEAKTVVATQASEKSKTYPAAIELVSPNGFINVNNITVAELVGKKVILVDFWTYSCINCQRTIPYLNAWYEKYADAGLEIIGVHTPEFDFEKDKSNVEAAVRKFGIKYPVVQDNEYATWSAYRNRYWPRKYLIDIDGFIAYDHIGEGAYEETEEKIKELLEERKRKLGLGDGATPKQITTPAPEVTLAQSPETYFGAARNGLLANGEPGRTGEQTLVLPNQLDLNALYLSGKWFFSPEYAENNDAGASIVFRYRAKSVFLVASSESGVELSVRRDGQPLGEAAGADVVEKNGESTVSVKEARLYKLVEGNEFGEHFLEITASKPGLRAYTFTFG